MKRHNITRLPLGLNGAEVTSMLVIGVICIRYAGRDTIWITILGPDA